MASRGGKTIPLEQRLQDGHVVDAVGCWVWTRAHGHGGYGKIYIDEHTRSVHVVAYEHHVGLVPYNCVIRQRCGNRSCINPQHLAAVPVTTPTPRIRRRPIDLKLVATLGALPGVVERPEWQEDANCRGVDPDLFFPTSGEMSGEVKQICDRCDVQAECLAYCLANGEKKGIWGGTSERERRALRRQRLVQLHIRRDTA